MITLLWIKIFRMFLLGILFTSVYEHLFDQLDKWNPQTGMVSRLHKWPLLLCILYSFRFTGENVKTTVKILEELCIYLYYIESWFIGYFINLIKWRKYQSRVILVYNILWHLCSASVFANPWRTVFASCTGLPFSLPINSTF